MWQRRIRWRVVASLILVGLAGDLVIGISALTGILTTVSPRTESLLRCVPPAVERIWPMLEALSRFRGQTAALIGILAYITLGSVLLAVGLWKTRRWAAWTTTALMLLIIVPNVYGTLVLVRINTPLSELVRYGRIPALAWSTAYLLLLWTEMFAPVLRVANAIKSLRRERVVLH